MDELAIIGGGIGGITAAIYAKRAGIQPVIFEKGLCAGQLNYIEKIENFPGIAQGISGNELAQMLIQQLTNLDIHPYPEEILSLSKEKDVFALHTLTSTYRAKSIILALGASPKHLDNVDEKKFIGKGISYCAICDGFFFKNKIVAVVGGGNSACEDALYLANIAKKVYLIHRRDNFRAFDYLTQAVTTKSNIEILWNKTVAQLNGSGMLESISLNDTQTSVQKILNVDGLFVAIGYTPNTALVGKNIELDQQGFIITDADMNTSCEGIFACGDCIQKKVRQLITAASEGAIAAIAAHAYLRHG